jgi:hypothetical protein
VTLLQIKIKDNDKAFIILNLLKELPFVEVEKREEEKVLKSVKNDKNNFADLFGLWANRKISLSDIRKKAWIRN